MSFLFRGIIAAVFTPTDGDGRLIKDGFRSNIEFLKRANIDALLVLGSTGEFLHLSLPERKEVLETAISFAGQTPVVVNISHTNSRSVAELARHAKSSGAQAVTLLPPWFYPLSDDDLIAFFAAAGAATDLPLALYNFPERTGRKLTADLVRRIASVTKISGLKQSGGQFDEHKPIIEAANEAGFPVLTGWDTCIPEAMALGVKGCIGGLANFVPEAMVKIYNSPKNAAPEIKLMKEVGRLIDGLEFPLNIAAGMDACGLCVGVPKQAVSSSTKARYKRLSDSLKELLK